MGSDYDGSLFLYGKDRGAVNKVAELRWIVNRGDVHPAG